MAVAETDNARQAGTGQLLVNELMADNDSALQDPDEPGVYDDWFEVYNPGATAVDMSGMYITDNPNNPTKWKVPNGVTVAAKGYLVFIADSSPSQGPRHTSWALSKDGESVSIYQTDGKTLIDYVPFGPQRTDIAYGRVTDGAATFSLFPKGTPGAANTGALANWIRNGSSFLLSSLAPDSVASAFTSGIASSTVAATATPLPTTLSGVSVTVTDSGGAARPAGLYFVSPGQVNFLVPAATATGRASVSIRKQDGTTAGGDIWIDATAAGLFSANSTGEGIGLLSAVRADSAGTQTVLETFHYDAAQQKIVATPISLGAQTDKVYLVMYGSGIRGVKALANVQSEVGGAAVPVTFAGAQPEYVGLDQVNIGPLPRSLAGKGEVNVFLTVDDSRSNTVTVAIQ